MKRGKYISFFSHELLQTAIWRLGFLLLLFCNPEQVSGQHISDAKSQGRWDLSMTPMPDYRQGQSSFVLDGKIYILGGFQSVERNYDVIYNTLLVYDPERDIWDSTKHQTPIRRVLPGTVVVDKDVFVLGGFAADANEILYNYNSVDLFNPVDGTWQSRANFPGIRMGAVCCYGTDIYSIGGIDSYFQPKKNCYVYDIEKDYWKRIADMALPRAGHAVVPLKGRIYAIGGIFENPTGTVEVEIYDPVSDSWTAGPPLPFSLCDITESAVQYRDEIFILGGRHAKDNSPPLRYMLRFSEATNAWSVIDSLPAGRSNFSAEVIDGSIYLFGGYEEEYGRPGNNTWKYHLDVTGQMESNAHVIRVWPNPFSEFLLVDGVSGSWEIQFFSISGELIEQRLITGPEVQLDVRNYPGGIYVLRLRSGDQIYYGKVLKQ